MPRGEYDLTCSRIAADLKLSPPDKFSQGWEHEVADGRRVDGFTDYLCCVDLRDYDKVIVMSLVLGSYDDALTQGVASPSAWSRIVGELRRSPELYQGVIDYWLVLDEDELESWFAVTHLLRREFQR